MSEIISDEQLYSLWTVLRINTFEAAQGMTVYELVVRRITALEATLEKIRQEAKANEYALSQEANGTLCRCRYGTDMMGKVPEGSFCSFCGYRRYESVITGKWQAAAQQEKEDE